MNNNFTMKIGSTNYEVNVNFSKTSNESFNDKVFRLIKNDINNNRNRSSKNVKNN